MITKSFLDKVKKAINLVDLVSEYTEVNKAGTDLWCARCPHPDHNDSSPSFRIKLNGDEWSWWCAGCHCGHKDLDSADKNYGSDCFAFLQWMSDYSGSEHVKTFHEVVNELAVKAGIPVELDKNSRIRKKLGYAAQVNYEALKNYDSARGYLFTRGLTREDIDEWKIGVVSHYEQGTTTTRISFPLFTASTEVTGFSERILPWQAFFKPTLPKYLNSKNSDIFNKSTYLYGIHKVRKDFGEIRIVEGAMDVVLAYKYGAKNVVGTLGTSFTKNHACIIKNLNLVPCFCLDGDAAGQKGIRKAVRMLSDIGVYARVFIIPDGLDMAELALREHENLEDFIESHSMPYWRYLMQDAVDVYDSKILAAQEAIIPMILMAKKGVGSEQDGVLMKSFVKERFGIAL